MGQFVYVIRKRIKVSPEKAIFMFVKNVLPPTGARQDHLVMTRLHSLSPTEGFCHCSAMLQTEGNGNCCSRLKRIALQHKSNPQVIIAAFLDLC